jgi:hypothetical protein
MSAGMEIPLHIFLTSAVAPAKSTQYPQDRKLSRFRASLDTIETEKSFTLAKNQTPIP